MEVTKFNIPRILMIYIKECILKIEWWLWKTGWGLILIFLNIRLIHITFLGWISYWKQNLQQNKNPGIPGVLEAEPPWILAHSSH